MAAGSIVIDLLMKTAGFSTDTARAEKDLKRLGNQARGTGEDFSFMSGVIKGAIGAISVGILVDKFKGLVDGLDALNDLQDATGSSIEKLSALENVGARTGTAFESVASTLVKFNKTLGDAKPGSDALAVFEKLGLSVTELKRLDPAEALQKTAIALQGFANDGQKARYTQELFGKSVREAAPFLKDLAEAGKLQGTVTEQAAQQAEDFNKQLFALSKNSTDAGRSLVSNLIPALNDILKGFNDAGGGIRGIRGALDAVGEKIGFGQGVFDTRNLQKMQKDLADLESRQGDRGFIGSLLFGSKNALDEEIAAKKFEIDRFLKVISDRNKVEPKGFAATAASFGGGKKESLPDIPVKKDKEKDDFTPLIRGIREKIALDRAELDSTIALTDAQKLQAKIFEDIDSGYSKLTLSQKLTIDGALQELLGIEKLNKAKQEDLKWIKQSGEENDRFIAGQQQMLATLQGVRDELDEQVRIYGLTADELRRLENARKIDTAAALESKAAQADSAYLSDVAELYRGQAKAIREAVAARNELAAKEDFAATDKLSGANRALTQYLENVRRAGDATFYAVSSTLQGLEDLTVQALSGGDTSAAAKSFVDGIIKEIYRLYIVKPLLESIFGSGGSGSGWAGLLGTIGSAFSGSYNSNYSNEGRNYQPRAAGGSVMKGGAYIVGERGPEPFIPTTAGRVLPNSALGGGATNVTVNVKGAPQPTQTTARRNNDGSLTIDMLWEQFRDRLSGDVEQGGPFSRTMQNQMGVSRAAGLNRA